MKASRRNRQNMVLLQMDIKTIPCSVQGIFATDIFVGHRKEEVCPINT